MQTNNKLREALKLAKSYLDGYGNINDLELHRKVDAALAEPIRNCEIGTAEEQTERYRKFCSAHKYLASDFTYLCKGFGKGRCPFSSSHTKSQCEFAWSQSPYEEGGAE